MGIPPKFVKQTKDKSPETQEAEWNLHLHGDRVAEPSTSLFSASADELTTRVVAENPAGLWIITHGIDRSQDDRKCIAEITVGKGVVRIKTFVKGTTVNPLPAFESPALRFELDLTAEGPVPIAFLRPGDQISFSEQMISVNVESCVSKNESASTKPSVEVRSSGAAPNDALDGCEPVIGEDEDETDDDDLDALPHPTAETQATAAPFSTAQSNLIVEETPRAVQAARSSSTQSPTLRAAKTKSSTELPTRKDVPGNGGEINGSSPDPQIAPAALEALEAAGTPDSPPTPLSENKPESPAQATLQFEEPKTADQDKDTGLPEIMVSKKQPSKRNYSGRGRGRKPHVEEVEETIMEDAVEEASDHDDKKKDPEQIATRRGPPRKLAVDDDGDDDDVSMQETDAAEPQGKQQPSTRIASGRGRGRKSAVKENGEDVAMEDSGSGEPDDTEQTSTRSAPGRGRGRKRSIDDVETPKPMSKAANASKRYKKKLHDEEASPTIEDTTGTPVSSSGASRGPKQSQPTPKSASNQVRVVFSMSGVVTEGRGSIAPFLKKHNIIVVQELTAKSRTGETQTICCVGKGKLQTTAKVLMTLALGCMVVSEEWIEKSVRAKTLLDPDPFIIESLRTEKAEDRRELFAGKTVIFTPAAKKSYAKGYDAIRDILKAAGADKVDFKPAQEVETSTSVIVIGSENEDGDALALLQKDLICYKKDLIAASLMQAELLTEDPDLQLAAPDESKSAPAEKRRGGRRG
ncbi:hypothetical protein K461DRAFT_314023 [Myriangium duriaei CBS 260.36]|uniref:BRCT domain-containing protein n=1 Tax=Myriangium duriaei CBS 260.36 TaxID=1168546 RepID=A0A9P4J0L5_9PEZI|nr:hypothetical protein K461DRAFT_314023 [Myriangium duriaei CBS 260.36]